LSLFALSKLASALGRFPALNPSPICSKVHAALGDPLANASMLARVNNHFKSEFKLESRDEKWIEEQGSKYFL
jgi:hypothetical protein